MSSFKFKRGQESKVSSLAREDGSLIFSLNGANDSTLRMDAAISGTVQRVGIAVDKAKNADVATKVVDYGNTKNTISIGYAGTGLTASNLTHIAGYTDNGTKIKDVSKDVLKNWLGVEASSGYLKRYRDVNEYGSGYTDLNGTLPPFIFAYKSGYPLHDDPDFASGMNGIRVYDNSNSGNVTIERIAMQNGNSSGYVLKISNKGAASPSLGGWYFGDGTAYARQYTCIFRAKIPEGYKVQWNSNSIGTNGNSFWLTERAGTGKWEWYAFHVDNGSASFSSTNYFSLEGTAGTSSAPVVWYLSSANTYINSYSNYDGLRTRYADNATSAVSATNASTASYATNASTASYATIAAYPQGFNSKTTSASWGNTTGTFITGWHTSSGGDVAFMNDNPSSGQVSMKLDGYFYQNEGAKRVLDTDDGATFVKKAGDTMTGQLNLAVGQNKGLKLGAAKIVAASASNGEFVLQGGHLRLGADTYDYNQWAGLKYDHSKKAVYLGIADGSIFAANQAQSNGSIFTPGISNIYLGASTATRLLTSSDGAGYVKKSGDTMTGALNFANGTWNLVGDDVKIGDHNVAGGLGILGNNSNTRVDWCKYGDASKYQSIVYDGTKLATSGTFQADFFNGLASTANTAKTITPFENATANAARNVWFSDSATRNKPCYNDNFKYNPVSNLLTTNISGSAAKWTTARTISLSGDLTGSFSLDGSQDVSTSIYTYNCKATTGNKNNYPYHRIAKLDTITSSYVDKSTLLYISQDYDGGYFGLIRITLRTNNVSGNAVSNVSANWLIRRGFSVDAIQIGHYKIAGKTYADVFYKSNGAYATLTIRDFGSGSRSGVGRSWSLVSSSEANDTTTSDKKTSSECWTTIDAAGTALHGQVYSETISGSDVGTVAYANNSGALGGSSLSQVLTSAGNGQAFTGLDTTTNNVVKLTRANGGTVQKTINNVSNASSASYAANANRATTASTASIASTANYVARAEQSKYLYRNPSARAASANLSVTGNGGLQTFKATSSMTTGKPPWDSHVIHMDWDTTGGWNAQIAVAAQTSPHMAIRGMNGTTWDTKWNIVLDSANYSSYAADRTALSGASVSGRTVTFTRANGSTFSITTQDNNTTYPISERALSSTFANGFRKETYGSASTGWYISAIRTENGNVTGAPQYGSGIAWGRSDTHGYLYVSYSSAEAYLGGGNQNKLNWQKRIAFTDSKVASASSADVSSNANKLGGLPSTDYALKSQLSGDINALNAKYLATYASASIKDAFFYRYGQPGNASVWTGFPSTYLSSTASTANGFGNGMYQKNVGILHLAAGSSYHDLVFQAGGTNDGIVYAGSERSLAYLLDTQNYKTRGNNFNSLTAVSLSVSSTNVVIDGGSY